MSIPKEIMLFRGTRANELRLIADSLKKNIGGNLDTAPIIQAAKQLEDDTYIPPFKNGNRDENYWGYEIQDFVLPVETIRHIRPKGIKEVAIYLDMKVVAPFKEWRKLSDPLAELSFRVVLRGCDSFAGFHIDRHDTTKTTSEPHPIYHLQYVVNPLNSPNFDYGSVLQLDTPRIVHYPMEFILGIGFLTSNFYPTAFQVLLDDGIFTGLYKKYQEIIWKPHAHSIADHWPFEKADIVWKPTQSLCPYLI